MCCKGKASDILFFSCLFTSCIGCISSFVFATCPYHPCMLPVSALYYNGLFHFLQSSVPFPSFVAEFQQISGHYEGTQAIYSTICLYTIHDFLQHIHQTRDVVCGHLEIVTFPELADCASCCSEQLETRGPDCCHYSLASQLQPKVIFGNMNVTCFAIQVLKYCEAYCQKHAWFCCWGFHSLLLFLTKTKENVTQSKVIY